MSEKTIGRFISDLRKSKGITQKELAQKLNVSDKAVSRWERDESNPDLQLIPVIADIFGVTCDELLRGEKTAANINKIDISPAASEKETIRKLLSRFKNLSYISCGIFALGFVSCSIIELLSAWIYPALRYSMSFGIGTFLYAVSIVCQLIILNVSLNSAKIKLNNDSALSCFKRKAFTVSEFIIGLQILAFGLSLPSLIKALAISIDGKELFYRVLCGVILTAAFALAIYFYNKAHFKDETIKYNSKLILKLSAAVICILLCLLLVFYICVSHAKAVYDYEAISFNTVQEFKEYNESLNIKDNTGYSELELPSGESLEYSSSLKIVETKFSKTKDFFPLEIKIQVQKYSHMDIVRFWQKAFSVLCLIDFAVAATIYIIKRKKIKD